jgi:hypothetical protein
MVAAGLTHGARFRMCASRGRRHRGDCADDGEDTNDPSHPDLPLNLLQARTLLARGGWPWRLNYRYPEFISTEQFATKGIAGRPVDVVCRGERRRRASFNPT